MHMWWIRWWIRDDDSNLDCPGLSMPFLPPAAVMFLLGDVFDGHWQQDDPALVPFLTPHAGLDPPPLWVVHGESAFDRACKAVWGRADWAIVLLVPAGPAPDADASPVPELLKLDKVPHDPHVAVTSLREGGAAEQGTIVVFRPHRSMTVWGAEYTTVPDAIKSVCGCNVHWRPHGVHWPNVVVSPELTASNAALLGRVVVSPHSDVAWLEPHRYCWVPVAARGHQSGRGEPWQSHVDRCHPWHGSRGGDHRGNRLPTPHASFRPHGARGGCFHHWGATARSLGGPVPRHQRTNLPLHQPAHFELGGVGAAPAAT